MQIDEMETGNTLQRGAAIQENRTTLWVKY
jgi:hypothetical protein